VNHLDSCGEQILIRSRSVVARMVGGETLIVPIRGKVGDLASIYRLNGTGSLIWRLLESPATVDQLAAAISKEFEVTAGAASRDVQEFVCEMQRVGLVEIPTFAVSQERPVGREERLAAEL
jgi:Coenzyme PQQ synthesis protein D (PqqD)